MNSPERNDRQASGEPPAAGGSSEPGSEDPASHHPAPSESGGSRPSLIGTRVGEYQVMRKLGRGGMADVYAARQVSLGRDVALKVLRSDFARDKDYIERFRREARAAAKLNHPNIVQVYDVGSANSLYYIAQELIDGENLRQVIDLQGPLAISDAIDVLIGVASALEIASEAGITHRDIKPENVMRSSRGIVKVADFGLARGGGETSATQVGLTQVGLTLGTPLYMSPEQVQGKTVDARSDLYSLGITMYHLLAGRPPFEADDPLALAVMHLQDTPPPLDRLRNRRDQEGNPDLPEWLIAVIGRLMAKAPADRFQSPSELLDAISNQAATSKLSGLGVGTAAATIRLQRAADEANRQTRRRRFRIAAAVLLPLLCSAVAGAVAIQRPASDVTDILRPEFVEKLDSVQQQYLFAVRRDDEAAWLAVSDYFPPGRNATNTEYTAKAMIQLARYYVEENRLREASDMLEQVLRLPNVDKLYQAVALARHYFVLEQLGDKRRMNDVKRELQGLYGEFENSNRRARYILERTLDETEELQLGLGDT